MNSYVYKVQKNFDINNKYTWWSWGGAAVKILTCGSRVGSSIPATVMEVEMSNGAYYGLARLGRWGSQ